MFLPPSLYTMLRSFSFSMLLALLPSLAAAAPSAPVHEAPPFLPAPLHLELQRGQPGFCMTEGIRVDYSLSYSPQGRALIRAMQAAGLPVLPEEMEGDVSLCSLEGNNPEGYELRVTPQGICIGVNSDAALPLVAQTLAQAVVKDAEGKAALPSLHITNEP